MTVFKGNAWIHLFVVPIEMVICSLRYRDALICLRDVLVSLAITCRSIRQTVLYSGCIYEEGAPPCVPSPRVAATRHGHGRLRRLPPVSCGRDGRATGHDTATKLVAAARAVKPARISR